MKKGTLSSVLQCLRTANQLTLERYATYLNSAIASFSKLLDWIEDIYKMWQKISDLRLLFDSITLHEEHSLLTGLQIVL